MKRYPFKWSEHAHDIDLRLHRAWLDMRAMDKGEVPYNEAKYNSLEKLHADLSELYTAGQDYCSDGRITWFTGQQIGLAKETVLWASHHRAEAMIAAGHSQFLQYL